jgi:hypothetical protein
MQFVYIILFILLILLIYILFFVSYNSSLISKNYLKNGISPINISSLSNYNSNTYSYEIWIYVNSLNATSEYLNTPNVASSNGKGNIFYINNCISLDIYNNDTLYLHIYDGSSWAKHIMITSALDLQTWQQIIISVTKNNLLDLFLNGKLISSIKVEILTPPSTAKLNLGLADAYISNFNRFNQSTDTNTAWKRYIDGNAGYIPIHAGVSLINDSKVSNTYTFF